MRDLFVIGVSHRTAPLALRERLAVAEDGLDADLRRLAERAALSEAVLLSTCNRVEIVCVTGEPHKTREAAVAYFNERVAPNRVDESVYAHGDADAVRHLFRVASGLDSMVLGEPQILGQVKQAFETATRAGTVGTLLDRSFQRAFRVAKRVRTETSVAAGNVSVSSIACELAERIFGEIALRRVLLVGAGKMSEVAARTLTARGALLRVVNRDPERARKLAEACGGEPRPLEALATELAEADVVICSTAKPTFVISHELMVGVSKLRRHRPLFLIDIAVPRDVDPRVGELGDVFLYDIDDLQRVSHENLRQRERAAQAAEEIVSAEVADYDRWLRTLDLGPTIVALRARVRETVRRELERAQPQGGAAPAEGGRTLDALAERITGQLLHAPLAELKRANETEDGARVIELVQRMFRLAEPAAESAVEETLATESNLSPNRGERA